MSFVDFALVVDELSVAATLAINPVTDVVVTVRVDEPSEAVVHVIHELSFVDNVIDLLSNTSNLSVWSQLSLDILVVLTGSELKALVDWDLRVCHDVS